MNNAANAATRDSSYTSTSTDTTTATATSFSRLRYFLHDPNLLDGFLPISSLSLESRMRRPANVDATDRVDFVIKTHSGVWCRRQVMMSSIADGTAQTVTLTPGTTYDDAADGITKPTCTIGGDAARPVTSLDSGELGTHTNTSNVETLATQTQLDVEVYMRRTGTNRTFQIDQPTVSAEAGGYDKPDDPFTVTWNPLTANPSDGTPRPATRPSTCSVRCRCRTTTCASSTTGTTTPPAREGSRCSTADGCPTGTAIPWPVSSAVRRWSPTPWGSGRPGAGRLQRLPRRPSNPTCSPRRVGPVQPFRRVLLNACVIDTMGTAAESDDQLMPAAMAQAKVADKSEGYSAPGAVVTVTQWKELRGNPIAYGANARTAQCAPT